VSLVSPIECRCGNSRDVGKTYAAIGARDKNGGVSDFHESSLMMIIIFLSKMRLPAAKQTNSTGGCVVKVKATDQDKTGSN
jgi:hypothetical protein